MPPPLWQQVLVIASVILGASATIAWWIELIEKKEDRGEDFLKKLLKIDFSRTMEGWEYLFKLLGFTLGMGTWIFAAGFAQGFLPMNPDKFHGLPFIKALHLAMAVITHTNWPPFAPEHDLTPFTQTFAVGVCNILTGAIGIAAWRALARAIARRPIGNAWAGIYRGLLILLPIIILLTGILISQGVVETFNPKHAAEGPVASFVAGSVATGAGAGWVADNAASAIENPTVISDIALLTALIAVPLGFCFATGGLIKRRGLMILLTLSIVAVLGVFTAITQANNTHAIANYSQRPAAAGPIRWTLSESLYMNATAGSGNGSQNVTIESFKPTGRLPPFLTLLGGVPFPPAVGIGVGTLLMYLLIAIYLASLMSGRSPDFLGFKARMGLVASTAVGVLGPQLVLLTTAACLVLTPEALAILKANGPYGMSSLLWAIGSWTQNNGSAYSLDLSAPVFIRASIIAMGLGRIFALGAVVMLASHIAKQKDDPPLPASVEPKGAVMLFFWIAVMLVAAILSMLPLIMMGPLLEVVK